MSLSTRTLIMLDSDKVWATKEQAESLATLMETRKGGFARIYGYTATSGRTVPTVYDATVTTRFSYLKLLERQCNAMKALTVADIKDSVKREPKLAKLSAQELSQAFNDRMATMLATKEQSLILAKIDAVGDDAHRQAHARCYLNLTEGVVIHYDTVKDADGLMQPVLTDGFPTVDSIMLNCLEVSRHVRVPGEYKVVNSGVPVLIGNAIEAAVKAKGVRSMNRIALKEGNFERLVIDGETVLPEDCVGLV